MGALGFRPSLIPHCPGTEVPGYSHRVPLGRAPERQSLFESRRTRRRFTGSNWSLRPAQALFEVAAS